MLYLKLMENRLFGFLHSDFRKLAYQLAVRNNKNHPFNPDKCEAGKEWLRLFLRRYKCLSLGKPGTNSAARAMWFNRVNVSKFFDLLCGFIYEYKFSAEEIFHCDETSISSVSKCRFKILATKGKKQVGDLSSAERGQTVTVEICFNSAGRCRPPMLIFPRQKMKAKLMDGAPPGAWGEVRNSGLMQMEVFEKWFKKFIKFLQALKDHHALLLFDGYTIIFARFCSSCNDAHCYERIFCNWDLAL